MVRAVDLVSDEVVGDMVLDDSLGRQEVVETPADVARARVHHVRPESVSLGLGKSEKYN